MRRVIGKKTRARLEGTSLKCQDSTYPVYYRQNEAERDADGRGALGEISC